jgi:5-methylcytosine-specific restriction endonuclease McrA
MPTQLLTDGSSLEDVTLVEIDRSKSPDRWRFSCPNGHTDWDRTNSHIWCRSCAHAAEQGAPVDTEHYELLDKQSGEKVPWAAVRLL